MAEKKGGLGRGIGALIPTSTAPGERPSDAFFSSSDLSGQEQASNLVEVPGARFGHLDVNSIVPNAKQPRSVFEPEAFAELVHSIREFGVLQPIVVRSLGEKNGKPAYELIMGERRLRASKEAGRDKIPAVIRETADENMLRDALLENLHRSQLNPLEEASAYQQLLDDFGITQDELANRLGRSRPLITNTIRLLKLPVAVQKKVAAGVLSAGHARAVLSVSDDRMEYFANKAINEGLSVRALEELVAIEKPAKPKTVTIKPGARQDLFKSMAERLSDALNTPVKIQLSKAKGQIVIDFANLVDLKRILADMGQSQAAED